MGWARRSETIRGLPGVSGDPGHKARPLVLLPRDTDDPREAAVHCGLSYDLVLSKTFPSLLSLLRPSFLLNVIALHPFGSLWGRCARYFKTDRMRRAFSFGSMYLGSSPFDSPGTYSLLQWTETCEGIVSLCPSRSRRVARTDPDPVYL